MPYIGKADFHTVKDLYRPAVRLGHKLFHHLNGILHGVVRFNQFPAAALGLAVFPFGFLFLDMGRIFKHDVAEVGCRIRRIDRPGETVFVQMRDPARMVDMGMGQQHSLNLGRGAGQVGVLVHTAPLLHAAVNEEAVAGGLHKGTAAGNLMRGAYKRQFHCKPSHLWQVIYPLRPAPYCGASGRTNGWAKFSVRSLMFIRISQNTSP